MSLRGVGGGGGWGKGGLYLLALLAFFPSVISFFLPKIRAGGGGAVPLRPSPRSATALSYWMLQNTGQNVQEIVVAKSIGVI